MATLWKRVEEIGKRKDKEGLEKFLREEWPRVLKHTQNLHKRTGLTLDYFVLKYICWMKWQTLPEILGLRLLEGFDLKAYDQLAWAQRTLYKWLGGKLNFKRDLRIKGHQQHSFLMVAGLLEGGFDTLTQTELADSFDELCPCGESHSEDALRKMRDRFLSKLPTQQDYLDRIKRLQSLVDDKP